MTAASSRGNAKSSITRRGLATRVANAALVTTMLPAALSILIAPLALSEALIFGVIALTGLGWLMVPPLLLGSLVASLDRTFPGRGVRVEGDQLLLGQPEQAIARADIVGGILVDRVSGACVELSLRQGGLLRVETETEAEAIALLRELALDSDGRARAHELATAKPAIRVGTTLLLAFVMSVVFGTGLALMQTLLSMHSPAVLGGFTASVFLLVAWLATARRAPSQIVLGNDGVEVVGFSRRFIPYREIANVTATPEGVFLVTSGASFGKRLLLTPERGPRSDALVEELRAAALRARRAERLDAPAPLEQLDRGQRSLGEWRAALKQIATETVDYRRSGIEREQLVDTASDVRADKTRRVAAALALAHTRDEGAIERVRIAVDGLADGEMRSIMSNALEDRLEDEALEELLAASEAGKEARKAPN